MLTTGSASGKKSAKKTKKKQRAKLSFADEEEEADVVSAVSSPGGKRTRDDDTPEPSRKKLTKNPNVDTSFLPDREREAIERAEREELRKQWLEEQERVKNEVIEITYSYWDGSGHRKTVDVGPNNVWHLLTCLPSARRATTLQLS